MKHLLLICILSLAGCNYNFLDKPELAASQAPLPQIDLVSDLVLESQGHVLLAGSYKPLRRFGQGTIYMLESKFIQIGRRKMIGGIYWVDGTGSPTSYCYYTSEFIPTVVATGKLSHISK